MKILWVKSGPLFPLNTGGRRRTHAMLRELAREHEVTYLALLPEDIELSMQEVDADYADEKIWIPTCEPKPTSIRFFVDLLKNFLFSCRPYTLDKYASAPMSEKLIELDECGDFDLFVCDFLYPAVNFDLSRLVTPTVLFQHNVESQIWRRLVAEKTTFISRLYFQDQFQRMWETEKKISNEFSGVIMVSDEDLELCQREYDLRNLLGAVPTGIDSNEFQPPENRKPDQHRIGFLGSMDWMPNIEAVHYFVEDIFPQILEELPGAEFLVIGRNPGLSIRSLESQDSAVKITGTVEDVRPLLDSCEVLVVPLRSGSGTRIKIFEAMAQGVPVISTSVGAEGLPLTDGENILIADSSPEFAEQVVRLVNRPELRESLAVKARDLVATNFSWESVSAEFIGLCYALLEKGKPATEE